MNNENNGPEIVLRTMTLIYGVDREGTPVMKATWGDEEDSNPVVDVGLSVLGREFLKETINEILEDLE